MSDGWDGWPEDPGDATGGDGDPTRDEVPGSGSPYGDPDPYAEPAFGDDLPDGEPGEEPSGIADTTRDWPDGEPAEPDFPAGADPYAEDWYTEDGAGSDAAPSDAGLAAAGAGADPGDEPGDETGLRGAGGVPTAPGYPPTAPPVGTDPDADHGDDDTWGDQPAPVWFGPDAEWAARVEPIDGHPWTDPQLLGAAPTGDESGGDPPPEPPDVTDLAGYAGVELPSDGDPWVVLAASDDPATSALARFWGPGGPAAPGH